MLYGGKVWSFCFSKAGIRWRDGELVTLNERKKERTIYVDADACPVKDEILSVASQFQVPVTFIASYEHFQTKRSPLEDWRFVDTHKEAADLVIDEFFPKRKKLIRRRRPSYLYEAGSPL
ncbi:hypothetical protein BSAF29S_05093 [Bacillus safensis subsp. safensis]